MQDGISVGLSAQIALERRLTTLASNIANTGTAGFRATEVRFEDVVARVESADQIERIAFASEGAEYANTSSGGMRETTSPFDFAINGDAWFAVETPAGTVVTRDGRFALNLEGELVSLSGHRVLDPGGGPIVLDPDGGPIEVGPDGFIRQEGFLMGALGLYAFTPPPDFVRHGDSGILADELPEPILDSPDVTVSQGFVENSNVDPVKELTQLISVQRAFEHANAATRASEESLNKLIDAFRTA